MRCPFLTMMTMMDALLPVVMLGRVDHHDYHHCRASRHHRPDDYDAFSVGGSGSLLVRGCVCVCVSTFVDFFIYFTLLYFLWRM